MATPDASEYLSVSMLNRYIKRKFDFDPYLKQVFVAGEVSNFRLRPAHQYFSLKDEHARSAPSCLNQPSKSWPSSWRTAWRCWPWGV
nr:exodeoxyribonuclease VII large subunit [Lacticaseibacillus thailandensis]